MQSFIQLRKSTCLPQKLPTTDNWGDPSWQVDQIETLSTVQDTVTALEFWIQVGYTFFIKNWRDPSWYVDNIETLYTWKIQCLYHYFDFRGLQKSHNKVKDEQHLVKETIGKQEKKMDKIGIKLSGWGFKMSTQHLLLRISEIFRDSFAHHYFFFLRRP